MKRLGATTVYYTGQFWLALAHSVTFTVAAVYLVRDVDLNPFQLVLLGTAMEVAIVVFEVPTGVVADTYSRRLSVVIGWAVMGAAMLLVGSTPMFGVVIAGYALWGLGYTFTSGAEVAWITDEVGVDRVGRVFARGQQFAYAGGLVGTGISVAAASVSPGGAVALGGVLTAGFAVFAAMTMPEHGFARQRTHERPTAVSHLRGTVSTGTRFVRARPLLLLILGIAFFAGASTESFDRLWEAHIIRDVGLPRLGSLDPVVWFGVFRAVTLVLGIAASHLVARRFDRVGQDGLARLLLGVTLVQVAAVAAFALSGNLLVAACAMWLYYLTRSTIAPAELTWVNQQIPDSRVRATVLSITGQSDALGQALGGPGVGGLGTMVSLRAGLLVGGTLLLPALGLYARAMRHGGAAPELEGLPASSRPSPD